MPAHDHFEYMSEEDKVRMSEIQERMRLSFEESEALHPGITIGDPFITMSDTYANATRPKSTPKATRKRVKNHRKRNKRKSI